MNFVKKIMIAALVVTSVASVDVMAAQERTHGTIRGRSAHSQGGRRRAVAPLPHHLPQAGQEADEPGVAPVVAVPAQPAAQQIVNPVVPVVPAAAAPAPRTWKEATIAALAKSDAAHAVFNAVAATASAYTGCLASVPLIERIFSGSTFTHSLTMPALLAVVAASSYGAYVFGNRVLSNTNRVLDQIPENSLLGLGVTCLRGRRSAD